MRGPMCFPINSRGTPGAPDGTRLPRRGRSSPLAWLALLFAAGLLPAHAAPTLQPLDAVRTAVEDFATQGADAEEHLDVKVGHLDPRLRLRACEAPLQAFQPPGSRARGSTTVGVRCTAPHPWTVYVPARIRALGPVLVLRQARPRGSVLRAADVKPVTRDRAVLGQGYFRAAGEVEGMVLSRSLGAGAVLTPTAVQRPRLVARGERVIIVASAQGLEVHSSGEALQNGARGDRIRVRNLHSRRLIEAQVIASGVVKVAM